MPQNDKNQMPEMEDISSTSAEYRAKKNPVLAYTSGLYKNLGNVIKVISFVIAFAVIILSLFVAFFLFNKTAIGIVLCLAVVLFGAIVAACIFFPLFGLGHILCQNNEILKMLNE
ncbi:MAG: hypothetical protein E7521_02325 [Ruminococcaceae bacterium]|nr:hypothetical protein [Oscillospiraceae bacterium]